MNKPRKFIDIVIPFNNEYLNLQILLPKILKVLKKIKYFKFRVILIDDGSIDKGHLLVNKFKKKYKNIFLLKNKIKIEGFESVAVSLSISDSATRNGDLGWINENIISKKLLSAIANTPVGNISKPILLPNAILIFKIRDKRKIEKNINLEEAKNVLVNSEKERILNMHSSSHYNNLRRSISIKFF